ncbi:uncharacterized protein LOC125000679 [Mugil cephalus]|uniref:uncharacterized protein LOC125000679 n=1 Tax=Mugil cephalus TaxID=48193 RepID=UPI001FB7774F|nr:uncharacterized protein LOC125000679 [Mugil cephalus]
MDLLLLMMMPLVLLGSEVQNVTEVRGKLGQDVSLNCSIMGADVHWSMEIHHHFRFSIGRSFFPTDKASYHSTELKTKYLINGTRLEIKNMSSEDGRLYYCGMKRNNSITAEESFLLLFPDVPLTGTNVPQQFVIVIVSCSAGVLFVLLVLGCVEALSCLRKKDGRRLVGDLRPSAWQTVQYEVIPSQEDVPKDLDKPLRPPQRRP